MQATIIPNEATSVLLMKRGKEKKRKPEGLSQSRVRSEKLSAPARWTRCCSVVKQAHIHTPKDPFLPINIFSSLFLSQDR